MRNSESEKRLEKLAKIARQDGKDMTEQEMLLLNPMKSVRLCKYVERYGSCKCCPYYQYVEKEKKTRNPGKSLSEDF